VFTKRVFGECLDKVRGGWGKLQNEELYNLYSLPNTVRINKYRRMRWVGHVAQMGRS
jgi:hypothetical protein